MASNGDTHPLEKDEGISGKEVNEDLGEASGVDESILIDKNKSAPEQEAENQKERTTLIFQSKELNVGSSPLKG